MKKEINSVLYRILVVLYFFFAGIILISIFTDWLDDFTVGEKFLAVIIFLVVTEVLRWVAYYIRTWEYQSLILSLFKK